MRKIVVFSLIAVLALGFSRISNGALDADDLMIYDSNSGYWFGMSVAGGTNEVLVWAQQWGWPGADTVSGDYDGDGTNDLAVYDQGSGYWYICSKSGETLVWAQQWGWSGAETVPGDYDGDGKDDLAVYDQASGLWYVSSVTGEVIIWAWQWGWPGAETVPGDYDGDGKDDLAVYDQVSGSWYIYTMNGEVLVWGAQWGWPGAETVPGDYDGDGKDDLAVYDQNTGYWYILSVAGDVIAWAKQWGWPGVRTVSGDFNGDDASDLAVFDDASGAWYIMSIADGEDEVLIWGQQWGWAGVIPVQGDYGGNAQAHVVYADEVRQIKESDSITLTSSAENGTYIFSDANASELKVGDIMLSTSGTGYLCRVTSVLKNRAGGAQVTATSVAMEEAFKELMINHSQGMSSSSIESVKCLEKGVSVPKNIIQNESFTVNMNEVVLYDADNNLSTKDDQVVANGSIIFSPEFEFKVRIDDFDLKYFKSLLVLNETSELKVRSAVDIADCKEEVGVATYVLSPVQLGPVVLVPVITLYVGIDGSVTASMDAEVTQILRSNAGLIYRFDKWREISGVTHRFESSRPTFEDACSFKAYTGQRLDLLLYGRAGTYVEMNGYLLLEAEMLADQEWGLYGGLEASAAAKIRAGSYVIADYETDIFDSSMHLDSGYIDSYTIIAAAPLSDNLLLDIGTEIGSDKWFFYGVSGVTGGDPSYEGYCFFLEDDVNDSAYIFQDVELPSGTDGGYLLMIGHTWVETFVEGSITRHPYLSGYQMGDDGSILDEMQGVLHTAEDGRWQTCGSIHEIVSGATSVRYFLQQASMNGDDPDGTRAVFGQPELHVFETYADAKAYKVAYELSRSDEWWPDPDTTTTSSGGDLTPGSFVSPAVVSTGGVVGADMSLNVLNIGDESVDTGREGLIFVGFYLSEDADLDSSDVLLTGGRETVDGYSYIPASDEWGITSVSVSIDEGMSIPSAITSGTYYLLAVVDELNAVAEASETNNVTANQIIIEN